MTRTSEREIIYSMYNGRCAYCGNRLQKGWHVDHFYPVKRNWWRGDCVNPQNDTIENKMPACPSCNINKRSMSIEQFREFIGHLMVSLNRDSTQYKIAKRYGLIEETGEKVKFYFETLK